MKNIFLKANILKNKIPYEKTVKTYSIARHLTISLIATVATVSIFAFCFIYLEAASNAKKALENKADETIGYLVRTLALSLWDLQFNAVKMIGSNIAQNEIVSKLVILDYSGKKVYFLEREDDADTIIRSSQVFYNGEFIGVVNLSLTKRLYRKNMRKMLWSFAIIILFILISLVLVTGFLIRKFLRKPLHSLNKIIDRYAAGMYVSAPVDLPYQEFQPFGDVLEQMGEKITKQMNELRQTMEALRKAHDGLEAKVAGRTAELAVAKERAEAASQAKSDFLASMSHELRTPLNAILGYAHILKRRLIDPDAVKGLNIVHQSGEHLLTLINDILDIAKIETGKTELHTAPVHFPAFLENIAGIIRSRAEAKHLAFIFEKPKTLPSGLIADETRLRQVLLNLLANAVKFTDEGYVALRVERIEPPESPVPRHPAPHALIRFEVNDTGPGISPDNLERIFKPFEQAGDISRRSEGTGLGLSISRQLVQLMMADLHVESEPGRGSTFWFELALPVTEAPVETIHDPGRVISGYSGPRRTILVVDDTPSNRAVMLDLLNPLGFEIMEAEDGQQAIQYAQDRRPDLILMDRQMPVMNGREAVGKIRRIPELEGVVVIAVSASVSKEDQAESLQMGFNAFLPKPVRWPRLTALLKEHLNLEWEYETVDEHAIKPDNKTGDTVQSLIPPPKEILIVLHDLAMMGDIGGILDQAAHIEALHDQYVPFTKKLRKFAEKFDNKKIHAFVKQYMEVDK